MLDIFLFVSRRRAHPPRGFVVVALVAGIVALAAWKKKKDSGAKTVWRTADQYQYSRFAFDEEGFWERPAFSPSGVVEELVEIARTQPGKQRIYEDDELEPAAGP